MSETKRPTFLEFRAQLKRLTLAQVEAWLKRHGWTRRDEGGGSCWWNPEGSMGFHLAGERGPIGGWPESLFWQAGRRAGLWPDEVAAEMEAGR